eukprot:TRINITY_DN15582_c0_g1_i1.p1 TRINITY_DN15582_c0_g1~~TRINITY_DN15582_c0_g1_i1.p1  ORF type:complete len:290 (+),score=48.37 TRINITY_DN15582_c0_g1_i1:33-902(+)
MGEVVQSKTLRRRKWGKRIGGSKTGLEPIPEMEGAWSDSSAVDKTKKKSFGWAGKKRKEAFLQLSEKDKQIELLPEEIIMEILPHLRPPDIIAFFNSCPMLRRRIDSEDLWKGCWYWLAEEFSGAVTVHRLLARAGHASAFNWKMLVLLDWRFQYKCLSYKTVRSSAKEWCARIREMGLVLSIRHTQKAINKIHGLLQSLKIIDRFFGSSGDEAVSTEDEYDHDQEWEMAIVSGMALSAVRREVISELRLPKDLDVDKLAAHYEVIFSPYKELVTDLTGVTESETETGW